MNDEQKGPPVPLDAPDEQPGAAAGMANTHPPTMPGTPAPLAPPPPLPTQIGTRMGTPAGMGGVRGAPAGTTAPGTTTPSVGQDIRHRGWYWHWNTLITQYAPLLGLKGVGLLNSYTVWTDRREGSPHQGYAFPTQDAEGKFYGEGREELITLNKVLVALDLIEIHKEMVLRQDDRNRRWRVPHNFYRVKDPRDGLVLNLPAVVRVLELANRDRNVFRHIRHIFSPQFAPIDRTSIWHYLLPELRALPLWQQLALRAEGERRGAKKFLALAPVQEESSTIASIPATTTETDDTASVSIAVPSEDDLITTDKGVHSDTGFVTRPDGVAHTDAETAVERGEIHAETLVKGSTRDEGKRIIESDLPSFVVPMDTTEDQTGETKEETSTSTRSTNTRESLSVSEIFAALAERDRREHLEEAIPAEPAREDVPARPYFSEQPLPNIPSLPDDGTVIVRALDVTDPSADTLAHQTASITDIETALTMANGRPPSDMEISLLVQVARECDPAAQAQGYGPGTGLGWVLAAIWEAVNSGSQFVAPKRIAAICDRWMIEGFGSDNRANPHAPPPSYAPPPSWPRPSTASEPAYAHPPPITTTDSGTIPTLPDIGYAAVHPATPSATAMTEAEGRRLWEQVMRRLDGILHPEAIARWFTGSRVTAIEHDRVTVTVPAADTALKLASYRGLISRRMSEALGRTVDVVFQATNLSTPAAPPESNTAPQSTRVYVPPPTETPSPWSWPASLSASGSFPAIPADFSAPAASAQSPTQSVPAATENATASSAQESTTTETPIVPSVIPTVALTPSGLSNRQIWAMALTDLQARMSGATFAVWIRPTELIAIDPDGTLVIGARNRVQRERLERQHLSDLVAVLSTILERPVGVRVIVIGETEQRSVS